MNPTVIIDPDFKKQLRPLDEDEYKKLEEGILRDGLLHPLAVWAGHDILLDGHNRYEICKANNLPYKVTYVELSDRDAAEDWIDRRVEEGGRRITPDYLSYIRGRIYNRAKKKQGRPEKRDHCDPFSEKTADRIAKEHGVSAPTIKRDGRYADAVAKVEAVDPEIQQKVASGTAPPKRSIIEAAKHVDSDPKKANAILSPATTTKDGIEIPKQKRKRRRPLPTQFTHAVGVVRREIVLLHNNNWRGVSKAMATAEIRRLLELIGQ